MSRKEKRKELKKLKRKQLRREAASRSAQEEVGEHAEEETEEEDVLAKEQAVHDEQERLWLLREEEAHKEWLRKQEEEIARKQKEEERTCKGEDGEDLEDGWEYVEDGPAEIVWQGNEIIVKKPKKKIKKGTNPGVLALEDADRPTSNPLPPQSTAFSSYQANAPDLTDQNTNFGTEQDKRNCPFYIKTGVCRFGVRCSRLHPVFNEACTLLMRSMYTGAGLTLEHVESLEYTDEEVAQEYEEFYDDVHSEFIQFGELVNFKVCRNGSPHLRGNVYVHYASQESAMLAYKHMNGRFYAKKQISCEFVGVKKWKIAICGEFMRTNYKTCSHGSACNFMHCFENPRREYEWADLDRPPPRFWQREMAKLFGRAYISDEDFDEKQERVRSYRESTFSNHMVRHRGDRVSTYDDDRRKDRHMKESVREDEHRRRSDGREQKYCEVETRHRSSRESKYDDQRRGKHSRDSNHGTIRREKDIRDFSRHDDSAEDKNTSRSVYNDDVDDADEDERYFQECKKYERWSPGSHEETDGREAVYSKDQRRGNKGASYDYEDNDNGDARRASRNSTTSDSSYHSYNRSHNHHSERHRSRRRSRSPDNPKSRRSRSRDRSMSHSARVEDEYYIVDEHQYRYYKAIRHNERSSKESKQHRQHNNTQSSNDVFGNHEGSETLEGRADGDVNKHRKRHSSQDPRKYPGSEHDQSLTIQEADQTNIWHSEDVVGTISALTTDEDTSGNHRKLESLSGPEVGIDVTSQKQETDGTSNSDTLTGLSLALTTDDVQKSTSQWQSWRKAKAKKAKLGMKDHPPRLVI